MDRNYLIRNCIAFAIALIGFIIAFIAEPDSNGQFGAVGGILLAVAIPYAFLTERIIEGLIVTGLIGSAFFAKGMFLFEYPYKMIETVSDEDTLWVIFILAIMACFTQLLRKAGGMDAFVNLVSKKVKGRKGVSVLTWLTSLFFFFDDYLNIFLRGGTFKKLTDEHKISREYLAYIVDSTAASVCIIVPISTWAVYVSGIFEKIGYAPEGEGISYFIKTIPFNFYAWAALLISFLVALGVIPILGPMKKAEENMLAMNTRQIYKYYNESEDYEEYMDKSELDELEAAEQETGQNVKKPRMINFLLPIIVIGAVSIISDMDILIGGFIGLIFTFILFIGQGIVSFTEFGKACLSGISRMLQPIIVLIASFTVAEFFMATGFADWLTDTLSGMNMPIFLMPFIVFVIVGAFEFFAGGEWSTYIIMMPIFIPLAMGLDANVNLVAAAIVTAGILGSNICLIAEATVLTAASTGCSVVKHTVTQIPYGLIAAGIAAVGFLICGLVL